MTRLSADGCQRKVNRDGAMASAAVHPVNGVTAESCDSHWVSVIDVARAESKCMEAVGNEELNAGNLHVPTRRLL